MKGANKMSNSNSNSNFIAIWHDGVNTHTASRGWGTEDQAIEWVETEKVLNGFVAWYTVVDRQTGALAYHAELNEIA
jgi:hypothetical protein